MSIARLQADAWALQARGSFDEAAEVLRRALHLADTGAGPQSPDTANLLADLAEVEHERGALESAQRAAEHALQIVVVARADAHELALLRIRILTVLGAVLRTRGEFVRSEQLLSEALGVATGIADAEAIARLRSELGVLCKFLGRYDDAEAHYQAALPTLEAAQGENGLALAGLLHNLGGLAYARGDATGAEAHARRAWQLHRAALGDTHPLTLLDAAALATALGALGQAGESEALFRSTRAALERRVGATHPEVAALLHNFAAELHRQQRFAEAEELYRRVLEIKDLRLGAGHLEVGLTLANFGALLLQTTRMAEARAALTRALAILERHLDAASPAIARARARLEGASIHATVQTNNQGESR